MKTAILFLTLAVAAPAYAAPASTEHGTTRADDTRVVPKNKPRDSKPADKPKDSSKDSPKRSQPDPPRLPPSAIPGANNSKGSGNSGGSQKPHANLPSTGDDHCRGASNCSEVFDGGRK